MKIGIVGNGALGLMTALSIRTALPDAQVDVLGPKSRPFSASTAAGAMANVYAEFEAVPESQSGHEDKFLEWGLAGSAGWKRFLSESSGDAVITAQDTLVALKRGASDFEIANYLSVKDKCFQDGVGSESSGDELAEFAGERSLNFEQVLRINGEFAFDTQALFRHLDAIAGHSHVAFVDANVTGIELDSGKLFLDSGESRAYDLLIIAAGAKTAALLDEGAMVEMFQGVGTAFRVPNFAKKFNRKLDFVVRTVNRGGAQCGIHYVPMIGGGLYIGAGNTVTKVGDPSVRFETVRYLLNTSESEFIGSEVGYQLEGEVVLGLRPRTVDGLPAFGPLQASPKTLVLTGTNRVGLTWAPAVAEAAANWVKSAHWSGPEDWLPDRKPQTFASKKEAIRHFSESRLSAAIEHKLVSNDRDALAKKLSEFEEAGLSALENLRDKYKSFIPNPDNWTAINNDSSE